MQTEVGFTLPVGLSDEQGVVHREGVMRLATARDELEPLRDAQVRRNGAYLSVLLLARTVTRIGDITDVTTDVVESLYAADFDHLQRVYERVNVAGDAVGVVDCPHCGQDFEIDLARLEDVGLGMTRPSQQELWAETAELAERFGWSFDAILDLEHHDRRRLLAARGARR